MKRLFFILAAAGVLLLPMSAGAFSFGYESHVYTDNTTDTPAWITTYKNGLFGDRHIVGAWSVPPHTFDKHGLRDVVSYVRVEIRNGAHHLDTTQPFPEQPHPGSYQRTYVVSRESDGRFKFWYR